MPPFSPAEEERERRAVESGTALLRAAAAVEARAARHLTDAGITPGQFAVLECLHRLGPLRPSDLARRTAMSRANVTTVCDNLARSGLARREPDESDRRQIRIHLTVRGRTVVREVLPLHCHGLALEMEALTPGEQDTLLRLCRKVGGVAPADP